MSKAYIYHCMLLCTWALSACDSGGTVVLASHQNGAHSHGISEIEPGVWPPTLSGITDQRLIPNSRRTRGAQVVVASARNSVLNNPEVRIALGDQYAELEASLGDSKSTWVASFLFFNYQTNQSVDIVLLSDGSIERTVFDASDYQPTENATEVQTAIRLATASMIENDVDVSKLHGTAMLAYPAIEDSEKESSNQFHSQRLLYVTFGEGDGVEPQYRALVNLSRNEVIDHREIQQ